MTKRKRSRKEISEEARREAENHPTVRRLRELALRGMTDEERQRLLEDYREAGIEPPPALEAR